MSDASQLSSGVSIIMENADGGDTGGKGDSGVSQGRSGDVSAGVSITAKDLIHAGFTSTSRALSDIERIVTLYAEGNFSPSFSIDDIVAMCAQSASPDVAIGHMADVLEKIYHTAPDYQGADEVRQLLCTSTVPQLRRLILLFGASDRLGRIISSEPFMLPSVIGQRYLSVQWSTQERYESLHASLSQETYEERVHALRVEYWKQIIAIAAYDVSANDPYTIQPLISHRITDLIDSTLRVALEIARGQVEGSHNCKFAVFAMGKLGAREINYVSDVDLIYIVDKTEGFEGDITGVGTHIGATLQRICEAPILGVAAPALWEIDTALRPEGKVGPLVRTVASCAQYYKQWAQNWEFQSLLKARFVAGDTQVGQAFTDLITPYIWNASSRPNFVFDCQAMRKRVEEHIALAHRDREIKLGKGGLRDVEFTVQMLQLVHGRTDDTVRMPATLDALNALCNVGYIARQQAHDLAKDYQFERVLEHRLQLWQMKRTHLFPLISSTHEDIFEHNRRINEHDLDSNADLRRLARSLWMTPVELVSKFDNVRRQVRLLHQDIYYRPMLPSIAQLSDDDITLSEQATLARFESIGFQDPKAAMRHVNALTSGINRASRINRILLPTVLSLIAQGQNPDMGLMMWRRLAETVGKSGPYLGSLRDSPSALQRLCHVISNSRYLGDALEKSAESTTWLADDDLLQPRTIASLTTRTQLMVNRFGNSAQLQEFATLLRAMRRREIERVGLSWMSGVIDSHRALTAMTDVYDAMFDACVAWAVHNQCVLDGYAQSPARISVIAMGRYGGQEVNFSSDADIMIVYEPAVDAECEVDEAELNDIARVFATRVAETIRTILTGVAGTEKKLDVDMDLRPEGKNGPLVRSLESCAQYYSQWAQTWERQALIRARYAAGDAEVAGRFLDDIAGPLRYSEQGLTDDDINDIRKLKARMEAESLPRGVRTDRHIKLGRGGLSDIEWTVQVFQLMYAYKYPDLRVTHTLDALQALEKHDIITSHDAEILRSTWNTCTDMRNANFLWSGRAEQADIIPDDTFALGGIASSLGQGAHRGQEFKDEVLSSLRKCREVVDRLFYGKDDE